ncbi:MAG TPA: ZIP family metal transporter [Candidatus Paceibacterota bacterium]
MNIVLVSIAAFLATFLGGLFALRFKDKLHLILGFSAGALIGVAFFDLLPEALELSAGHIGTSTIALSIALGFATYLILDRMFFMHCHEDGHEHRGHFGAGALSFHSFLDGIAIGVAFHVSTAVGAVVAAAVLAHDFSDGVNTVSMILRHGGERRRALKWLAVDALAPVVGVLSTFIIPIPSEAIAPILAIFCGFFLYIGASDLLPESHHQHPTRWTSLATVAGMALIWAAIHFAGV